MNATTQDQKVTQAMAVARTKKSDSSANIGFEAKLWLAADKLRNNMDAAEYKHVVLGLIFLKYISDSFDEPMNRPILKTCERPQNRERIVLTNTSSQKLIQAKIEFEINRKRV